MVITTTFLQKFISVLKTSKPGIIGPFGGSFDKKRWTTILQPHPNPLLLGEGKRVRSFHFNHYISGSFLAIHKKVVEKIGDFYEPYFMYYEDADLCLRAQKAGFSISQVNITGISHHDATSLGQNSFLHEYYLSRNHLLFVVRSAPLSVKLHELLRFPKTIYEHLKNKNSGALTGIKDYVLRRFGIYQQ